MSYQGPLQVPAVKYFNDVGVSNMNNGNTMYFVQELDAHIPKYIIAVACSFLSLGQSRLDEKYDATSTRTNFTMAFDTKRIARGTSTQWAALLVAQGHPNVWVLAQTQLLETAAIRSNTTATFLQQHIPLRFMGCWCMFCLSDYVVLL